MSFVRKFVLSIALAGAAVIPIYVALSLPHLPPALKPLSTGAEAKT